MYKKSAKQYVFTELKTQYLTSNDNVSVFNCTRFYVPKIVCVFIYSMYTSVTIRVCVCTDVPTYLFLKEKSTAEDKSYYYAKIVLSKNCPFEKLTFVKIVRHPIEISIKSKESIISGNALSTFRKSVS